MKKKVSESVAMEEEMTEAPHFSTAIERFCPVVSTSRCSRYRYPVSVERISLSRARNVCRARSSLMHIFSSCTWRLDFFGAKSYGCEISGGVSSSSPSALLVSVPFEEAMAVEGRDKVGVGVGVGLGLRKGRLRMAAISEPG